MLSNVLLYFIFITLFTFVAYAYDKMAARHNHWRISEKTLHVLALIGDWVGALFAQQMLRHKTVKQPFHSLFLCTIVLNITLCVFIAVSFSH